MIGSRCWRLQRRHYRRGRAPVFRARRCSRCASRACCWRAAVRLGGRARRVRRRRGGDGLGCGARLGRARPSGSTTSPVRCSRRRCSASARCSSGAALGRAARPALHRPRDRRRGRDAGARRVRRHGRPARAGSRRRRSRGCSRSPGARSGTLAVVVVACATLRRRPFGNALVVGAVAARRPPRR